MTQTRLTEEEKALLCELGSGMQIAPGAPVYLKGEAADKLYYIQKGRVRIYDNTPSGREITIDVIEAGHIFGESAFCEGAVRPVNVQAVIQTSLVAFRAEELVRQLAKQPSFALHLLQLCSDSIDRLTNRVEEQCLLDRYGKTASYLLDVTSVESADKGTLGGNVPYTHGELACALGLNRTTVTAVLKYFEQKHWISCGYGQIRVIDRDKLQKFIEEQKV